MTQTKKAVHPSLERLLAIAAEVKKTKGPAALASALNESEQNLNNWRLRGVSKSGALKAQGVYGCSPTWVLYGTEPKFTNEPASAFPDKMIENKVSQFGWPFKAISPADYNQVLTAEDRAVVENTALALFNARSGQSKQKSPAKYQRAH